MAWRFLPVLVFAMVAGRVINARTIHVDAAPAHSTNTIVPTGALGAGIARLPYGAVEKLLTDVKH